MMEDEYKSCPFCGGEGIMVRKLRDGYNPIEAGAYLYRIRCRYCEFKGNWRKSEIEAEIDWNSD